MFCVLNAWTVHRTKANTGMFGVFIGIWQTHQQTQTALKGFIAA
jgi:hypothetical protein